MVKADIALHGNPTSELRDVTCHMGSHSVTCHPTQVNAPRLTPAIQAGTRFTYPGGVEGWVDLVDCIWRPSRESNQRPFDHESDAEPLHHQDKTKEGLEEFPLPLPSSTHSLYAPRGFAPTWNSYCGAHSYECRQKNFPFLYHLLPTPCTPQEALPPPGIVTAAPTVTNADPLSSRDKYAMW